MLPGASCPSKSVHGNDDNDGVQRVSHSCECPFSFVFGSGALDLVKRKSIEVYPKPVIYAHKMLDYIKGFRCLEVN